MELLTLLQSVLAANSALGLAGAVATAVTVVIKLFNRASVQALLPEKAKFANWPSLAQKALPALLSAAGAFLAPGEFEPSAAALAALVASATSVGLHHITKKST